MKKKNLILLFPIVVLIFFVTTFIYFRYTQNIREKVLNSLKENFEFCQILRDKISFQKGEFWLICNGRPFYATYENGKVKTELNGWGFLKDQKEILDELKNNQCNFYNFVDNKLTFICIDRKVRMYNFSPSDFQLTKLEENLFINYFLEKPRYGFGILGDFGFELKGENFLGLNVQYKGYKAKIAFNLDKGYFTLPIVIDEKLPNKERARLSFELIDICKIDFIQEIGPREALLGLDCILGKPSIIYNFELGLANFLIKDTEFETLFPYLGKYNLPLLIGQRIKYIRSTEENNEILKYYLTEKGVIIASGLKESEIISEIYFKNEGLK